MVEVDQSGKFEQLNTHTVVACANGGSSAIWISAAVKRRLVRKLRKSLIPHKDLIAIIFAILTFLSLYGLPEIPSVIVIDEEYTGKDAVIKEALTKLLKRKTKEKWDGHIRFKKIGRASPAHILAWTLHRKKRPEARKVTEIEVLRWLAIV